MDFCRLRDIVHVTGETKTKMNSKGYKKEREICEGERGTEVNVPQRCERAAVGANRVQHW